MATNMSQINCTETHWNLILNQKLKFRLTLNGS